MQNILDFGEPFWEETTPSPSENDEIHNYVIKSIIYSTNSSLHYMCLDKSAEQAKIIKFIKVVSEKVLRIKDEIETITLARHQNIVEVEDCFRYDTFICIVYPYSYHLTLHQYLVNEFPNGFPEELAANFFSQMLKSVDYLHSINVWNRDIKLESFLVLDSGDNMKVLLCNFEYAKLFETDEKSTQFLGTPEFMAPEIVCHVPYTNSVDIWSLGVSLFMMLTGRSPFPSYRTSPQNCMDSVSKGLLNYQLLTEKGVSQAAILLIQNLCELDSRKRVSAKTALNNAWILEKNTTFKNKNEEENERKIADKFFDKTKLFA